MPTPIIVKDLLYTANDNGRLTVRRISDGREVYRQRLGKGSNTYSASAVASQKHLFFSSEQGTIYVVKPGEKYELIEQNEMKDTIMATPAISGDRLLVRTSKYLYCIAK